uniref:Uncharacterized protein n=1 Tax=Haptolina brevifila TaxID=156173 RepID=A0A7S2J8H9_9EUKA
MWTPSASVWDDEASKPHNMLAVQMATTAKTLSAWQRVRPDATWKRYAREISRNLAHLSEPPPSPPPPHSLYSVRISPSRVYLAPIERSRSASPRSSEEVEAGTADAPDSPSFHLAFRKRFPTSEVYVPYKRALSDTTRSLPGPRLSSANAAVGPPVRHWRSSSQARLFTRQSTGRSRSPRAHLCSSV